MSRVHDIVDPVARVRAINAITHQAKEVQNRLGLSTLLDWSQFTPPVPYQWISRAVSAARVPDRIPPPANLIVSNC